MPHFFEGSDLCVIDEYLKYEAQRVHETEIRVGEIYVVMFALKKNIESFGAARMISKVDAVENTVHGQKLVVSSFLDDDHQIIFDCAAVFSDGYWLEVDKAITYDETDPYSAYLRQSRDGVDDELDRILNSADVLAG